MSQIKIDRARHLTRHLPRAQAEILSSISPEMVASLTGKQLAMVMDALDRHWHKARAFESRDILAEGCIWDPNSQQLREIAASV